MCGRFNVTSDPMTDLFMDLLGQSFEGENNNNTSPMSRTWIIRETRQETNTQSPSPLEALKAQWWLIPSWVKEPSTKYSMFNARSESLRKSPAFRTPYRSQRCVVPISGFYEWVNRNGVKQPYYVHDRDDRGMLLAGIWDHWSGEDGTSLVSFAIVTTAVVPALKFLHHRQPVILSRDTAKIWTDQQTQHEQLSELCQPRIPDPLTITPVSEYVNNSRNFGPQCLEAVGDDILLDPTS